MNIAALCLILLWFIIKDIPKNHARKLGWTVWTEWSSCPTPCGGGQKSRRRYCISQFCDGIYYEVKECTHADCRDKYKSVTTVATENGGVNTLVVSVPVQSRDFQDSKKQLMIDMRAHDSSVFSDTITRTVFVAGALIFAMCAVVFTIFRVIMPYRRKSRRQSVQTSAQHKYTYDYPNCSPRESKNEDTSFQNKTQEIARFNDLTSVTQYVDMLREDAESFRSDNISPSSSPTVSYVSDVMWY